jgi:hypothetical protein
MVAVTWLVCGSIRETLPSDWFRTQTAVNGQVFVPAGGQVKVPAPRVDQVLVKVVPPLARAWRMR